MAGSTWDLWDGTPRGQNAGRGSAREREEWAAKQGLQQVAFVRSAVSEGPDLGDLMLDVLHVRSMLQAAFLFDCAVCTVLAVMLTLDFLAAYAAGISASLLVVSAVAFGDI